MTGERLVLTSAAHWAIAFMCLAAAGLCVVLSVQLPARPALGWTTVCVVFGSAFAMAYERSTFEFDASTSTLRWSRRGWFRTASGSVAFAQITDVFAERSFRSVTQSLGRGGARRLVILTSDGPIPVTTGYTQGNFEAVAEQVREFLTRSEQTSALSR